MLSTFWIAPSAGYYYIEVTTAATLSSARAYFLTVARTNGDYLVRVMDVLRPLDTIVKYIRDTPTTTLVLGNSFGGSNIVL